MQSTEKSTAARRGLLSFLRLHLHLLPPAIAQLSGTSRDDDKLYEKKQFLNKVIADKSLSRRDALLFFAYRVSKSIQMAHEK